MKNHKIDRLLRSAAQAEEETPTVMPFGFDTRVVAMARAALPKPNGLTRLIRSVELLSAAVIFIATLAAIREVRQSREQLSNSLTNEYAIADSAIQDEF